MKKSLLIGVLSMACVLIVAFVLAQVYPEGMVSFWKFDEGAGNTGYDSLNGNHGTIHGATWTTGMDGKALSFDGMDDYVSISDTPSLNPSEFSLSLWAKNTSPGYTEKALMTKGMSDISYRISVMPDGTVKFLVQDAFENFEKADSLTLDTDEDRIWSAVIDPRGEYAYFGTGTYPGKIVKVRLSDFTRVRSLTAEYKLDAAVIDHRGEYAYFGTWRTGWSAPYFPPKVVKVRLSDFTVAGSLTLDSSERDMASAVIDPQSEYAYFGTGTRPAKVVKVRLSDLTKVDSLTFNYGEDNAWSAAIDPQGEYAYFGTGTFPGKVVKVRLSDFTREGSITFESGENDLWSAVIDPKGEFAYFGTEAPIVKVVKVRLSNFTREGSITFDELDRGLDTAIIDPKGEFAYFAAWTEPGIVIKVNLSDFTRAGSITLESGEGDLYTTVMDPKGEFAYFGTAHYGNSPYYPAQVIKVRLSDFTTAEVSSVSKMSDSFMHIVATKDASNMDLYINGVLENSTPALLSPIITEDLLIGSAGAWWSGQTRCTGWLFTAFDGIIDEVAIYNRALTASEIQQHYQYSQSQALITCVESQGLPLGIETSLKIPLQAASDAIEVGNDQAAAWQLNGFIRRVEAARGNKLTDAQADELIARARRIISCLDGS